jgi:hypothetical protein
MAEAAQLEKFVADCLIPFPANVIGKLPRVTCSETPSRCTSRVACPKHKKQKCDVCGQWITTAHIHLDFVGHAPLTARLLELDPGWNWEPVAFNDDGSPLVKTRDGRAFMWIRLTMKGITRLGVGSVEASKDDVEKELIGDALRNAAMRFGLALDLWAKGDLLGDFEGDADEEGGEAPVSAAKKAAGQPTRKAASAPEEAPERPAAKKAAQARPRQAKPASAPTVPSDEKDPAKVMRSIPVEYRQRLMAHLLESTADTDSGMVGMWPLPGSKTLGEDSEPLPAEDLQFALEEIADEMRLWFERTLAEETDAA